MNANAAILLIVIATFCCECDKISEQTLACLPEQKRIFLNGVCRTFNFHLRLATKVNKNQSIFTSETCKNSSQEV